ncbi:MAG: hypothetical protein IT450_18195 [Phycisphaerales bacterium]|nr:hypothetical protein [Phycisphaerales bacterium]
MGWLSKRKRGDADDAPLDVPPGATVDPALFPEDEFPVECLGCGYALRGLPDGRCPECGREFVRGHLLVETYLRCSSKRRTIAAAVSEVCGWTSMMTFALVFATVFSVIVSESQQRHPDFSRVPRFLWRTLFFDLPLIPIGFTLLTLGLILPRCARSGIKHSKRDAIKGALGRQTIESAAKKPVVEVARDVE